MSDVYEPELGQIAFGQPFKTYECPDYVESALRALSDLLVEVHTGHLKRRRWTDFSNPFDNTGASIATDVYEVHAYSWDEEVEQRFNFKWRDLEISWYKYLGRGMSMNRKTNPREIAEMLSECMAETLKLGKKS